MCGCRWLTVWCSSRVTCSCRLRAPISGGRCNVLGVGGLQGLSEGAGVLMMGCRYRLAMLLHLPVSSKAWLDAHAQQPGCALSTDTCASGFADLPCVGCTCHLVSMVCLLHSSLMHLVDRECFVQSLALQGCLYVGCICHFRYGLAAAQQPGAPCRQRVLRAESCSKGCLHVGCTCTFGMVWLVRGSLVRLVDREEGQSCGQVLPAHDIKHCF